MIANRIYIETKEIPLRNSNNAYFVYIGWILGILRADAGMRHAKNECGIRRTDAWHTRLNKRELGGCLALPRRYWAVKSTAWENAFWHLKGRCFGIPHFM